ncbi:MAG: LysM peptidoglycan-binding domain-containing protein [Lachnospiraceae bacterium]
MSRERTLIKSRRACLVYTQRISLIILAITFIIIGSVTFGGFFSDAHNNIESPINFQYYKSIQIQKGDTLWGLAKQYRTEECKSITEYINTLKQINGLDSDDITESKYLTVVYSDKEFH